MQKQLQVWQALVGLIVALISSGALFYNWAVSTGRNMERIDMNQKQHEQRITKVEVNAEMDRQEVRKQYQLLNDRTYEILIFMQNKQDRKK